MNQQVTVLTLETIEGFNTIEGFMKPISINEHVSVIYTLISKNSKSKPHSHKSSGIIFLLKGQLELIANETHLRLTPGSISVIPANTVVGINTPDSSAEVLMISARSNCKSVQELKSRLQSAENRR
jgi:quercetin dioxygenase-like cupin family protein